MSDNYTLVVFCKYEKQNLSEIVDFAGELGLSWKIKETAPRITYSLPEIDNPYYSVGSYGVFQGEETLVLTKKLPDKIFEITLNEGEVLAYLPQKDRVFTINDTGLFFASEEVPLSEELEDLWKSSFPEESKFVGVRLLSDSGHVMKLLGY